MLWTPHALSVVVFFASVFVVPSLAHADECIPGRTREQHLCADETDLDEDGCCALKPCRRAWSREEGECASARDKDELGCCETRASVEAAAARKQEREAEVAKTKKREAEAAQQAALSGSSVSVPSGFVLIPAGSFTMGSPNGEENGGNRPSAQSTRSPEEEGRRNDETQHEVVLSRDFFLQSTEVTQGDWQDLMGTNPSLFSSCGRDCPVEQVSWWDAVAYANALSQSEGLALCYVSSGCSGSPGEGSYSCTEVTWSGGLDCEGYRLPTEAEWEYAARAGSSGRYYDGSSSPDAVGWYFSNSGGTTHAVAGKQPNAWGLYDMHGNVWEWVWDWYREYPSKQVTEPTGPDAGSLRVVRGGCWDGGVASLRAANRSKGAPGDRSGNLGFRLSRSVP